MGDITMIRQHVKRRKTGDPPLRPVPLSCLSACGLLMQNKPSFVQPICRGG